MNRGVSALAPGLVSVPGRTGVPAWRRVPVWVAIAAPAALVTAGAQIWIPLSDSRAGPTVVVVLAATVVSWACAAGAWGWRRASAALAAVVVLTWAVEWVGTTTGWPFGPYEYTGALQPQLAGVPVVVPFAWFAVGVPALALASQLVERRVPRVLVAAAALTAWDLFLDPQMVDEGYWRWQDGGFYRDIPLTNYAGWFVSAVVILGVVDRLTGVASARPSVPLLYVYMWWAVMETVGFVVFFGDPLVGLVGGTAMGVPSILAWRRARTGAGQSVAVDRGRVGGEAPGG